MQQIGEVANKDNYEHEDPKLNYSSPVSTGVWTTLYVLSCINDEWNMTI